MQKRKYTSVKALEQVIPAMRSDGVTLREIGDEPGLSNKQMKNWSYRYNSEQRTVPAAGESGAKGG